jgi:hypothetical protein
MATSKPPLPEDLPDGEGELEGDEDDDRPPEDLRNAAFGQERVDRYTAGTADAR